MPWNVVLNDRACVGDLANLYSLALIEIGEGAIVAQEAYLCTGSHDFSRPELPLIARSISIGAWAFIGARAFILPGRTVGERAIVGACAVVTKDIPAHCVAYGHPAEIHPAQLPGKKRA